MSKTIFLSHAPGEQAHLEEIKRLLEGYGVTSHGEDVDYIDLHSPPPAAGSNMRDLIKRQIGASSDVVLVATNESLTSEQVNYEIGMADALKKPIVVLREKELNNAEMLDNLADYKLFEFEKTGPAELGPYANKGRSIPTRIQAASATRGASAKTSQGGR